MKNNFYLLTVLMLSILVALVVSGCAGGGKSGSLKSFLAKNVPSASFLPVAEDLAEALAVSYPPGRTSIYLKQSEEGDKLGPALETSLRKRGFTLAAETGPKILTAAYVLDRLDDGLWYSKLTVSSGLIIARIYRENGQNLEPDAATKTNFGEGAYGR